MHRMPTSSNGLWFAMGQESMKCTSTTTAKQGMGLPHMPYTGLSRGPHKQAIHNPMPALPCSYGTNKLLSLLSHYSREQAEVGWWPRGFLIHMAIRQVSGRGLPGFEISWFWAHGTAPPPRVTSWPRHHEKPDRMGKQRHRLLSRAYFGDRLILGAHAKNVLGLIFRKGLNMFSGQTPDMTIGRG